MSAASILQLPRLLRCRKPLYRSATLPVPHRPMNHHAPPNAIFSPAFSLTIFSGAAASTIWPNGFSETAHKGMLHAG